MSDLTCVHCGVTATYADASMWDQEGVTCSENDGETHEWGQ